METMNLVRAHYSQMINSRGELRERWIERMRETFEGAAGSNMAALGEALSALTGGGMVRNAAVNEADLRDVLPELRAYYASAAAAFAGGPDTIRAFAAEG